MLYFKGYMKAVKGKLEPEQQPEFEKAAAAYAKKIIANFKDFEFVSFLFLFCDESIKDLTIL